MATNQADEHHVFWALSPELALEVTPRDTGTHRDAVAAGYGGALLFLQLLMGVIVAWHRWHRVAARKNQERAPQIPRPTQRRGRCCTSTSWSPGGQQCPPCATTLQDPQVTYAELRRPQGQPREPGDTYGNVL